jgi:hypothetical protein
VQRLTPKGMKDVKKCLEGCPADMRVEVEPGVPVDTKIVADLRSLWAWPPSLVLIVPGERYPESVVKVERAS